MMQRESPREFTTGLLFPGIMQFSGDGKSVSFDKGALRVVLRNPLAPG
jgi:hypothetical protein